MMKNSATFINAVMDVRIEQGVFHFCLGEMVPRENSTPDFVSAFRCILPASDAVQFFTFLRDKAENSLNTADQDKAGVLKPSSSVVRKPLACLDVEAQREEVCGMEPSENLVKRKIAVSDGGAHGG